MGRVASGLDDSIRIHNDPDKLERRPEISKVNVNKGKCSAPRVKRANQIRKCSMGSNWLCCCEAGEDLGGKGRGKVVGSCRLNVTQQWTKTCKSHSGKCQEQCHRQVEEGIYSAGIRAGETFFFFLWYFQKAVDQLEREEINKNLLQDRISGERLEQGNKLWFKLM